jgi:hypothetical protein
MFENSFLTERFVSTLWELQGGWKYFIRRKFKTYSPCQTL